MFAAAKDAMASRAAQSFLNSRIERYGKVTGLKIDSKRKTMEATCLLEGELDPITVRVGRYAIEEDGGKKFISAGDLTCSRPWAQSLMKDFLEGKRVELPSWATAAL